MVAVIAAFTLLGSATVTGSVLSSATSAQAVEITTPAPAAEPAPAGCNYATAGTGPFANTLCWLDLSSYNETISRSAAGQPMSLTLPGGYKVSFNVKTADLVGQARVATAARVIPNWNGSYLGNTVYTGIKGKPALMTNAQVQKAGFHIDILDIAVTDSSNRPVSGYGFVVADGEATGEHESLQFASNVPLKRIDASPASLNTCGGGLSGLGTTFVNCVGATAADPSTGFGALMMQADQPKQISANVVANHGGAEGVAFGFMTSKLTLTKNVSGRVNATDSFDLDITSPESTVVGSATTGTAASATTGAVTVLPRTNASSYTFAERTTAGSNSGMVNYSQNWVCTNAATGSTTVLPSGSGLSKTVSPQAGDDISCVLTNTAKSLPLVTCTSDANIFNTAYDAATGTFLKDDSKDANWQVSGPFAKTTPATAVSMPPADALWDVPNVGKLAPVYWPDSPYGNAQWITQQTIADQYSPNGDWYYRYQFILDPAVDPANFTLGMNFLADNSVAEVFVNGVAQSGKTTGLPQTPEGEDPYRYGGFYLENAAATVLANDWATGLNTIMVQIKSDLPAEGFNAQIRPEALCPAPAFTVDKTVSSTTAFPGDTITYTVTVKNTGNVPYTAEKPASFTDDMSKVLDDARYKGDANNGATVKDSTLSWSGPLDVGESKVITYTVKVNTPATGDGSLENSVVPGPEGSCEIAENCVTTTNVASFSTLKSSPVTEVIAGETIPYTVTVTNTGKVPYTAEHPASFTDDFSDILDDATYNNDASDGATYSAPTLAWSGELAVGETKTITYSVTVNDPLTGDKQLDNAVVTPPTSGGDCPQDTNNANCYSEIPGKAFTVEKKVSKDVVIPGETVSYTITVKNVGKTDFTDKFPASISDDLAKVLDDATYNDDASNGAIVKDGKLTWSGALAVGSSTTITYSMTVLKPNTGDSVLTNSVIPTTPGGTCATVDGCTTTTGVQSFTVLKDSSPKGVVHPGEKVTYSVTITNTGSVDYTTSDPAGFTDDFAKVLDDATYNDDADNGAIFKDGKLTWSGALEAGKSVVVTYSVTVDTPDNGDHILENVAVPTGPGGSCTTECEPVVNKVAEFKIAKKASNATVNPGDTVNYTVVVSNTGQVDYTAEKPAGIKDDLSKVLDDATYNDDASNGATVEDGKLLWSGPLAIGESTEISYSVTVNTKPTGDYSLVNAVVPNAPGGYCEIAADCTTTTNVASFTIDKTSSAVQTTPGDKVSYAVTVTNTGKVAYTEESPATFTDNMAGVLDDATYNGDADNGATYKAPVLSWSGALALGESKTVTYSVTVNDPLTGDQVMKNVVTTPVGGGCATEGSCETETKVAAIKFVKTSDSTEVVPGDTVNYTITVSNIGAVPYTGENAASFTDDLSNVLDDATYNNDASDGATYSAPTLAWSGDLAVGETKTITYSVTVNDPLTGDKKLVNAVVSEVPGSTCPAGTTNPECITSVPTPHLSMAKSASANSAVPGDKVTYTITITNDGVGDFTEAKPASFTDDLSAVLDDAVYNGDVDNGAKYDAPVISWTGALAAGDKKTFTYSVTVNDPATGDRSLRNVVKTPPTVPSNCVDGTTDPACFTITNLSTFEVAKTASADTAKPGETVSYAVTVTNTGQVAYSDEAPAGFSDDLAEVLDDATYNDDASNGAIVKDGKLSWSGALAVGETKTITYSVTVNSPATGDRVLDNVALPTGPGGSCAVEGCPPVTSLISSFDVAKTSSTDTVKPGEKVSYTITVTNTGKVAYTKEAPASFRDDMSKVLDNAAYNKDADNGATFAGTVLSWSGPLAVGESTTIHYSVTVNKEPKGTELVNLVIAPQDSGAVCQTGSPAPQCQTTTGISPVASKPPLAVTGATIGIGAAGIAVLMLLAGGTLLLTRRARNRRS